MEKITYDEIMEFKNTGISPNMNYRRDKMACCGFMRLKRVNTSILRGEKPIVYLNMKDISYIARAESGYTKISVDNKYSIEVEESVDEILRLLSRWVDYHVE